METHHLSTAPAATSQTPNQSKPTDRAPPDLEIQVDDQESSNKRSPVRSYECIFCKKGFTNAQALGGHMNIHRKDRNKLKKPSRDTTDKQISQIPHVVTNSNNISQSRELYYFKPTKGTPGTSTEIPRSQEFNSRGLKRAATWPALSLPFGKKSNTGEGSNIVMKTSTNSIDQEDIEDIEVDLELRLGFKSSVGNEHGTRRFF